MRKCALAAIGLILCLPVGTAGAVDMPLKAPPAPPAVFSWNGCYGGGNAGWIWDRTSSDLGPSGAYLNLPGGPAPPNTAGTGDNPGGPALVSHGYARTDSGFAGGVQAGCNKQFGVIVLGVEADWQWSGLNNTVDASYPAIPAANPLFTVPPHSEHVSSRLDWFSTFRARAGIAFDRLLIYGTAGLVLADVKSDTAVNFGTFPILPVYNGAMHAGSSSNVRPGAVVGSGAEWALARNWSVEAELLYMWLGGLSLARRSCPPPLRSRPDIPGRPT